MHRVFEKALLGEEHSPKCGSVAYPLNHSVLRESTEKHRNNKLSILCGKLSIPCDNKHEHTKPFAPLRLCGLNNHTTNTIQALKHLCSSISATTYAYSSSHMVEWPPHTHDHSTLFSSITILQVMATAREKSVSRAGHYTIRPPAGTCRGNPP